MGHKLIIQALAKLSAAKIDAWPKWVTEVLWVDQICIRELTGCSPFFLVYGRSPILSADVKYKIWMT
ncbi:hypothetical protein HMI54_006813, partial [Coelomomyces lativittatus]